MYKGKIICVDDDPSILKSLRSEILQVVQDDYEIELASSIDEAFDIIDDCILDDIDVPLVVSDCIMPVMKGDEFLIQVHQKLPNTKSIMLTGQANVENIKNAINKASLYRFLVKPWDKKDLLLTVSEALKSYEDNIKILMYQKSLEDKIQQRTKELQDYVNLVDKYVISSTTSIDGIITQASEAFCKISGYTKDELIGKRHNIIRHEDMPKEVFEELWSTIKSGNVWKGEVKNRAKDGSVYWVENTISPIFENGKIIAYSSIRHDITAQKLIERQAITDELTSVYNRRYFNNIFAKVVEDSMQNRSSFAFIVFDIDYFKRYNDYYGHQKGDEILQIISKTIKKLLIKSQNSDYVFRLGGEEFGIICKQDYDGAIKLANDVLYTVYDLRLPHEKSNCSDSISLSIGVYYNDGTKYATKENIYKLADEALYRAKEMGRNRIEIFEDR